MKSLIVVAALLCLAGSISAQPLVPGKKVPVSTIAAMRQNKRVVLSLDGKYTILSFFSKNCMACLQLLPKLQLLQEKYPDKLQVILVTAQDITNTIWEKRITSEKNPLYYITKDSTLTKLFPHESVPHEIWINDKGHVSAITESEEINEKQIAAWLAGQPVALPFKNDLIGFDRRQPLLTNNGVNKLLVTDSSTIASYIPGQPAATGFIVSDDKKTKRIFLINQPLAELLGYGLPRSLTSRIVILAKDSARFFNPASAQLSRQPAYMYCYEITVPVSLNTIQINHRIRKDVAACFLLSSYIDCLPDGDGCLTDHLVIRDAPVQ